MAVDEGVTNLISSALGIAPEEVTEDLRFQSIPAWSSARHIELIDRIERETGSLIGREQVMRLTTVPAIQEYVDGLAPARPEPPAETGTGEVAGDSESAEADDAEEPADPVAEAALREFYPARGLSGVVLDRTAISEMDGPRGRLTYRGYSIPDLADNASFEEVAHLLIHGCLPNEKELTAFRERLASARQLPAEANACVAAHPRSGALAVLRSVAAVLEGIEAEGVDPAADVDPRERLIARIPVVIATQHALREGRSAPEADPEHDEATNLLTMLDLPADEDRARLFGVYLVAMAEHGADPSALAARVAASTGASVYAAVEAAIACTGGALDGGATEQVMAMIEAIGEPAEAEDFITALRQEETPVMGYGHRVYETADPRSGHLRAAAHELSHLAGTDRNVAVLDAVQEAMLPLSSHGLDTNVHFHAGTVLGLLGIPPDLFVAVQAASRVPGWLAHVDEQRANNVMIHPLLRYEGQIGRVLMPPDLR